MAFTVQDIENSIMNLKKELRTFKNIDEIPTDFQDGIKELMTKGLLFDNDIPNLTFPEIRAMSYLGKMLMNYEVIPK